MAGINQLQTVRIADLGKQNQNPSSKKIKQDDPQKKDLPAN